MRLIFTTLVLLIIQTTNAQITSDDSTDLEQEQHITYQADTLLPFHGTKPLRLYGYETRVIPYNSKRPLYVGISYQHSPASHFEYFRADSSTYLLREYFRSAKGSSNDGLKASGYLTVQQVIVDSGKISRRGPGGNRSSVTTNYFLALLKQGVWEEYQDSFFCHRYWTGNYRDNKRVGVWNEFIYQPGGDSDYHLSQVNYDIDSTKAIITPNLARHADIDTITKLLQGRWNIACEDAPEHRMQMSKCEKRTDGTYSDDCNDRFGKQNYYDLLPAGVFKRQKGETCKPFKQNATTGRWRVYRLEDDLLLEVRLSNAAFIRYKIWYLDLNGAMLADRR